MRNGRKGDENRAQNSQNMLCPAFQPRHSGQTQSAARGVRGMALTGGVLQ